MKDKTIICIPNATTQQIKNFIEVMENNKTKKIIINQEVKLYYVKNNELFEVVSSLKKVK